MTIVAKERLEAWCGQFGVAPPLQAERIRAGRNSEVWRLSNGDGQWILKNYFEDDRRDRLGTEYRFLSFLEDAGVSRVARPLGIEPAERRALYSFLPGKRPVAITADHVTQSVAFLVELDRQKRRPAALTLPDASEACFTIQQHLDLAEKRLLRWLEVKPEGAVHADAYSFVTTRVWPRWEQIRDGIRQRLRNTAAVLPLEERIISPSDFGFHNTLEANGTLSFVDFEYAGWDDPAKLICDFICQPELQVSAAQGQQFVREWLLDLPRPDAIEQRVNELLPVHRVKWIAILLNEFGAVGRRRRLHAGVDADGLLINQLGKAAEYFKTHLSLL